MHQIGARIPAIADVAVEHRVAAQVVLGIDLVRVLVGPCLETLAILDEVLRLIQVDKPNASEFADVAGS